MIRLIVCFSLLVILIFVLGCEDDNPFTYDPIMTADQFPNEIGYTWTYLRTDSLSMTTDTMIVRIVDSTSITDSGYLMLWEYEYDDTTEIKLVNRIGDTIYFYAYDSLSLYLDFQLVFPIEVGSSWNCAFSNWPVDSFEVIEIDDFDPFRYTYQTMTSTAPMGPQNFHAYRSSYNETGPQSLEQSHWLLPHVGLVRFREVQTYSRAVVSHQGWELISFNYQQSMEFEDFPIELGNQWVYQLYDSANNTYDTTTVTIIDSFPGISPDISNQIWAFTTDTLTTQQYMSFQSNNAMMRWSYRFPPFDLEFPLMLSKCWGGSYLDSTCVESIEPLTTPAGYFPLTFKISGTVQGFESFTQYTIWIVPDYGIVRIDYRFSDMMLPLDNYYTWQLLEYQRKRVLPDFTMNKFPLITGAYWNYLVYNQLIDCVCTLKAEIGGGQIVNDTFHYGYITTYLGQSDTEYIHIRGDTMLFSYFAANNAAYKGIIFPFNLGDGWSIMQYNDTSEVIDYEHVPSVIEAYFMGFNIESWLWCGDECGHKENEWYIPHVGLGRKYIYEEEFDIAAGSTIVHRDETWELLNYYIPLIWIDCTAVAGANEPFRH